MKALLQRVCQASVTVDRRVIAEIGAGLLVFICAERGDAVADADGLARKVAKLRIFADAAGKMNRSLLEVGGGALVVSQFTLSADTRKGNRPSFTAAAPPAHAKSLYTRFCDQLALQEVPVATGVFAAHVEVGLVNDGPVTLWLDTRDRGN